MSGGGYCDGPINKPSTKVELKIRNGRRETSLGQRQNLWRQERGEADQRTRKGTSEDTRDETAAQRRRNRTRALAGSNLPEESPVAPGRKGDVNRFETHTDDALVAFLDHFMRDIAAEAREEAQRRVDARYEALTEELQRNGWVATPTTRTIGWGIIRLEVALDAVKKGSLT